ncbi:MAG: hypothetical protein Q8S44_04615 [Flavobacteriaceae bacterium]|nr:hypothetical protein [Flavobacteriaceae bacterium]
MKYLFAFLMILSIISSCNQKSELALYFNCNKDFGNYNLKTLDDINKNYSMTFPSHWKSSFYFDEYQSDIYIADTTKSLTSTYILNISNKKGDLIFDQNFKTKLSSELALQNLQLIKLDSFQYLETDSYFVHATGNKNNYNYNLIEIYKPSNNNSFFEIKIELYGDNQLNDRICEAIYFSNLLQDNTQK